MTCVFKIMKIVCIINNSLKVTFIIAHSEIKAENIFIGMHVDIMVVQSLSVLIMLDFSAVT